MLTKCKLSLRYDLDRVKKKGNTQECHFCSLMVKEIMTLKNENLEVVKIFPSHHININYILTVELKPVICVITD